MRTKFDNLWAGDVDAVIVQDLGAANLEIIRQAIINRREQLKLNPERERASRNSFASSLSKFVPATIFNFPGARLYPHQEYAFEKALSRWPIRALLADEVGLGKTLEMGSILSYLVTTGSISSALILAPKSVVKQLQAELYEKFGFRFLVWDSSKNRYLNHSGEIVSGFQGMPGQDGSAPLAIVSSQWARGNSTRPHIFTDMKIVPNLLIVDEAHAARVSPPESKRSPSLLYKALETAKAKIPHLLLMTATPMQIHVSEYHGLLDLLDLPKHWSKLSNFELAVKEQARSSGKMSLNSARSLVMMKREAAALESHKKATQLVLDVIENEQSLISEAAALRLQWPQEKHEFIKSNPASSYTIRNTRSGLEKFGYKFPTRVFSNPDLKMSFEMLEAKVALDQYLANAYGQVEELLASEGQQISKGFVVSIYEQRFASSLWALRQSLTRRKLKLETLLLEDRYVLEFDDDDLDELDSQVEEEFSAKSNARGASLTFAVQNEVNYLVDCISAIDAVPNGPIQGDPKLVESLNIISKNAEQGNKTIVFSRYTDTIWALLENVSTRQDLANLVFGVYTGGECWVREDGKRKDVSKSQLQSMLRSGSLSFVLCSDAASEGINLQSANCMINVDVPWNPGRLEQRIGRIARLGQVSLEVHISNMWYPNSVEATMYGRLLERKELYELAVGAFPDLFAKGIRELVGLQSGFLQEYSGDVLDQLEALRDEMHLDGLTALWGIDPISEAQSSKVWSAFSKIFQGLGLVLSPEEGIPFEKLRDIPSIFETGDTNATLSVVENTHGAWSFILEFDNGADSMDINIGDLPWLIGKVFGLSDSLERLKLDVSSPWIPEHCNLQFPPNEYSSELGSWPSVRDSKSIQIGRIRVDDES